MKIIEQGIPRHMRGDITNGDLMVLRDELARLQAERRWIPVWERLPEFDPKKDYMVSAVVLVEWVHEREDSQHFVHQSKSIDKAVRLVDYWSNLETGDEYYITDLDAPKFWMPLPEPPASEVGG